MPDKINVNEELGIIEVESFGLVTKDDISESINAARELHDSKDVVKILVDATKQNKMPGTVDIYNLFANLPLKFKIAILARESGANFNDLKFGVTVAKNRGTLIKLYTEKQEALDWLNK